MAESLINGSISQPSLLLSITFALALVPLVAGIFTSYLKVSIVFGLMRNAFGTQAVPTQSVVLALSVALTSIIMTPVAEETIDRLQMTDKEVFQNPMDARSRELLSTTLEPWRSFLYRHCGQRELSILISSTERLSMRKPSRAEVDPNYGPDLPPWRVLLPAFVVSELKESLVMGVVLLLPFLAVDLLIANILAGLGMFMLSPSTIGLPLKLLLFVQADGWLLMSSALIRSYL